MHVESALSVYMGPWKTFGINQSCVIMSVISVTINEQDNFYSKYVELKEHL